MSSLQGQLESLAGEVVKNRERINTVNKRVKTVESGQALNRNTSLQLVTTTDRLSTGLNQLRTELTANQQMVERISSQQLRIQNESTAQLQIVHTTLNTQLGNATDQLSTGLNQLRTELAANEETINLAHNRIELTATTVSFDCGNRTAELLQGQRNVQNKLSSIDKKMEYYYRYTCGGSPGWRRVAFLNMTDPNQDCPSGWSLTTHSVRTCGRVPSSGRYTCDPVTFPVSGGEYSRVCGRIRAYQYGGAWAFRGAHSEGQSLNGSYVDGISITHGVPRQHIWTFAAGLAQEQHTYSVYQYCYCDVKTRVTGYQAIPPSFVGNDYFCESGVTGRWSDVSSFYRFHSENPLWDGQNCGQNITCCSMNNPPYFMKALPAPTTDDIEVRMCGQYYRQSEYPVELLEIYVQ